MNLIKSYLIGKSSIHIISKKERVNKIILIVFMGSFFLKITYKKNL